MKWLEDIIFGAGLIFIGVGVGAYDWRLGFVVVGAILLCLPFAGMMKGRGIKDVTNKHR